LEDKVLFETAVANSSRYLRDAAHDILPEGNAISEKLARSVLGSDGFFALEGIAKADSLRSVCLERICAPTKVSYPTTHKADGSLPYGVKFGPDLESAFKVYSEPDGFVPENEALATLVPDSPSTTFTDGYPGDLDSCVTAASSHSTTLDHGEENPLDLAIPMQSQAHRGMPPSAEALCNHLRLGTARNSPTLSAKDDQSIPDLDGNDLTLSGPQTTLQLDWDWTNPDAVPPNGNWNNIQSYQDFHDSEAYAFWTWSQAEQRWFHEQEDGSILWCPDELD
jgi:hypothetical protein